MASSGTLKSKLKYKKYIFVIVFEMKISAKVLGVISNGFAEGFCSFDLRLPKTELFKTYLLLVIISE